MSFFRSLPRPVETYHSATYDRIAKRNSFTGTGKTILITGGASGVGYSISKAFAQSGATRVAIVSRNPSETAKRDLEAAYPSTRVSLYSASVTNSERMIDILHELGTVDVLVLCATSCHRRANATDISSEEMQDSFDVNVIATFDLIKAYLNMPGSTNLVSKTILNISSAAIQVQSSRRVGYAASKAATAQVLQHFAWEATERNQVRIFSFHPGAFYTPAVAGHFSNDESMMWDHLDLPGHFALWLAGPESDFLHGRFVWANWDVDELIALKDKLAGDPNFLTIGLVL